MKYWTTPKRTTLVAAALAMVGVSGAFAQDQPRRTSWEEPARRWQKASDLTGKPVDCTTDSCGKVTDLMVDTDSGRIVYALVGVGVGETVAVPFTALTLPDDASKFRMDMPKDQLKARAYDKNHQPDFNDRKWAGEIHKHFHQEVYWEGRDGKVAVSATYKYGTRWQKSSDLIGKEVKNPAGEKLGKIEELVIDPDAGRIMYAVLSFGGFLGMGDKLFAIPTSSLTLSTDYSHFILAVPKEQLRNATGFDKKSWPNMADQRWATETNQYYGVKPYWQTVAYEETAKTEREGKSAGDERKTMARRPWNEPAQRWQKGTDLIGKAVVETPQGEDCGKVDNLIVDAESGRILYAILALEGKQAVIPYSALYLPSDAVKFMFSGTKEQLKAHLFERDRYPDFTDRTWAIEIHSAHNQRPYWENPDGKDRADGDKKKETTATAHFWYHPVTRWQKMTDMIGTPVKNPQAEDLGKVDDLAVDPDAGRVICGIISFGGFLGLGDKLFAIPYGSLTLSGNSKYFMLDIGKDQLKNAAGFDRSHWPNITDERWMRELHKFYGQPVYWEGRTDAKQRTDRAGKGD